MGSSLTAHEASPPRPFASSTTQGLGHRARRQPLRPLPSPSPRSDAPNLVAVGFRSDGLCKKAGAILPVAAMLLSREQIYRSGPTPFFYRRGSLRRFSAATLRLSRRIDMSSCDTEIEMHGVTFGEVPWRKI